LYRRCLKAILPERCGKGLALHFLKKVHLVS
jgi:hypothetical protein